MIKKLFLLTNLIMLSCTFLFTQIKSDNGLITFNNDKYMIQIVLINNPKQAIKEWDNSLNKFPGTKSNNKFKIGDTVAPFIIFSLLNEKSENLNLKCNYNLLKPLNVYSSNRGDNVNIVNANIEPKLFYRSSTVFGWTFDNTDLPGIYQINIEIFDNKNFKQNFILKFELER